MRTKLLLTVAGLALVVAVGAAWFFSSKSTEARARNVVLIVMDTTRADHIGSYGYERDTTPNLDRLAERSTLFEQAYSHSPWTMPSMASIFTSLPPRDHGIVRWEQRLSENLLTLAEHLQSHDLSTAAFVSHIIFQPQYNYDQGFDHYDQSVLRKGDPVHITSAQEISDLAIDWLEENSDRPFFAWLHYFDPHSKYQRHPEHDFGRRPIDRYDSEIRFTDHHIGRVLNKLEELGRWDDTVIVFIADHGEEFWDHGGEQHTRTLYDELVRVPLTVYVPGIQASRIGNVVSESDLAPTLCHLLGLPIPESFLGIPFRLDGDRFRVERSRAVVMETLRRANKRGIRHERWKLIHDVEKNRFELFDMEQDPRERKNLFDEQLEAAADLHGRLVEHYDVERAVVDAQELSDELRKKLEALGYLH